MFFMILFIANLVDDVLKPASKQGKKDLRWSSYKRMILLQLYRRLLVAFVEYIEVGDKNTG